MNAVAPSKRQAITAVLRTYLDHLAVERGVAANTLASYRRDLGRYRDYLEAVGITSIDAVDALTVTGFLAYLREGDESHPPLSATSSARAVVAVRGLHRFALRDSKEPTIANTCTFAIHTAWKRMNGRFNG